MKTISNALAFHLAQPDTSVAMLWKLKRADGTIFGFTDHDVNIQFNDGVDNVLYEAAEGVTGSATTTSAQDVSSQEIIGFLDDDEIKEQDIFAGLYNYATVEIRLVNWADLTMGALLWKKATLGEVKTRNGQFTAELRGLEFWLTINTGEVYGPQCRADFGDALCTKDVSLYRQTGSVNTSANRRTFVPPTGSLKMVGSATPTNPAPATWFDQGVLAWTSGLNAGFKMEVIQWDGTTITLFENMPYAIQAGDTYTIEAGCDKTIATCYQKFNNVVNHRGEPLIPGMDQILIYPNSGGSIPT